MTIPDLPIDAVASQVTQQSWYAEVGGGMTGIVAEALIDEAHSSGLPLRLVSLRDGRDTTEVTSQLSDTLDLHGRVLVVMSPSEVDWVSNHPQITDERIETAFDVDAPTAGQIVARAIVTLAGGLGAAQPAPASATSTGPKSVDPPKPANTLGLGNVVKGVVVSVSALVAVFVLGGVVLGMISSEEPDTAPVVPVQPIAAVEVTNDADGMIENSFLGPDGWKGVGSYTIEAAVKAPYDGDGKGDGVVYAARVVTNAGETLTLFWATDGLTIGDAFTRQYSIQGDLCNIGAPCDDLVVIARASVAGQAVLDAVGP